MVFKFLLHTSLRQNNSKNECMLVCVCVCVCLCVSLCVCVCVCVCVGTNVIKWSLCQIVSQRDNI